MKDIEIEGVAIKFPFEPYEVQNNYMSKVLQCLQNGQNGILESPTGTGKTLCLLCSSLAWLELRKAAHRAQMVRPEDEGQLGFLSNLNSHLEMGVGNMWGDKRAPPKIIYSSRTHSQLSQAVKELKQTSYNHFKIAVIGSRDQLCIHPQVSKETSNRNKVQMCQVKVKARNCFFYNQVDNKKTDPSISKDILDIEDLVKLGNTKQFCPYYMSRELKQDADVIFMPYNYLIDPASRKAHGIELQGNIVIFDEAHNIESCCEESASLELRSTDIALAIDDVTHIMKKLAEMSEEGSSIAANDEELPKDFRAEDLYILKSIFLILEKELENIELPKHGEGKTFDGSYMIEFLEKADVTFDKKNMIIDVLDNLIQYLTTSGTSPFQRKGTGLMKFQELMKIVFSKDNSNISSIEKVKKSYKVHINVEANKNNPQGKDGWGAQKKSITAKAGRTISYWCFNPGFAMNDLVEQGCHSIILTSGTLSPINWFSSELGIPFEVTLENPHIIREQQVNVSVVTKGPDGWELNSSFRTRDNPKYLNSLGRTIQNFANFVNGGFLVFFPSYFVLKTCQDFWQENGTWNNISNKMPIYVEPQSKDNFLRAMSEFYQKIEDPTVQGACFFAVCRGKVSEGLDFANRNGRAVVITGLPYPPSRDPKVMLKMKYLDEMNARAPKNKKSVSGRQWYNLQAVRAVNQAIGRVIRHKDDYGAILLCDSRFQTHQFTDSVSKWVKPHLTVHNAFGPSMRSLSSFFKKARETLPQPDGSKASTRTKIAPEYEGLPTVSSAAFSAPQSRINKISSETRDRILQSKKATNNCESAEGLCSSYSQSASCSSKSQKPKSQGSIFSSFKTNSSVIDFNNTSSMMQTTYSQSDDATKRKRKRIEIISKADKDLINFVNNPKPIHGTSSIPPNKILKNSDSVNQQPIDNAVGQQSSSTASTSDKKDNKAKIFFRDYFSEVHRSFSFKEYIIFKNSIGDYSKTLNYEAMFSSMSNLFIKKQHHHLLKSINLIVQKDHKEKFKIDLENFISKHQ